ncbi:HAD family phosphatase [Legionella israelensis]|uniref:HAD family phosphatase n=1 Tax=Legionella israelensis TaxID=454 RepID=A0AAX1ED76_9GAMM|nr:HAD family phosphatase [Legionella israelensis]QBR83025.1 HAD family phosphatase [Legionella israelensis]
MNKETELIIFDNDGVLVDSEIIWHQFFTAEMTRLGYVMSIEQSLRLLSDVNHGKSLEDILKDEFGLSNMEIDFSKIGYETEASYPSLLKPVKNIQLILDYIDSKKIKKCIASNGDFKYIKRTLDITGLNKYFNDEAIIGIDKKTQRKPAPYVFLQAANRFSVSPNNCLIIEDHVLGIKAAKKAQIKVVGFLGASHAQNDEHRNWIVNSAPEMIINNSLELLEFMQEIDL